MEQIANILKERREELGLSLADIEKKTKIPVAHLAALEAGDLSYFEHNLSYVRYYVRAYASALYLDYGSIQTLLDEELKSYEDTRVTQKIEMTQAINKSVRTRTKTKSTKRFAPDFSVISFIVLAVLLVAIIVYTVFAVIIPGLKTADKDTGNVVDNPTTQVPDEPEETEPEPEETTKALTITENDASTYTLSGYDETDPITISITFQADTWVAVYKNYASNNAVWTTENPVSNVIQKAGTTLTFTVDPKSEGPILLHLGKMSGNTYKINDQEWTLDATLTSASGPAKIQLLFGGTQ